MHLHYGGSGKPIHNKHKRPTPKLSEDSTFIVDILDSSNVNDQISVVESESVFSLCQIQLSKVF